MTAITNRPTGMQPVDILVDDNLRSSGHRQHDFGKNSGFSDAEKFVEFSKQSEKMARQNFSAILRNPRIPADQEDTDKKKFFFNIQKQPQNSQLWESLARDIDPEFIKHGGGTLYEYAKLAQLRGQKVTTITIHESRMLQLLYGGEEDLAEKGIARGEFVESEFAFLLEQAKEIGQELGVKIEFVLELENFGKGAMGDDLREKRQPFRDKFQYKVLSTHFMRKNPNFHQSQDNVQADGKFSDNHAFIDGSLNQFDQILSEHSMNRRIVKGGNIAQITKLVNTYAVDLLDQVEREGQKGMILGHCDLIKLNIHKLIAGKNGKNKEQADEIISQVFAQSEIQDIYGKLFDAVNKKEMFVELNLAGSAKGVGVYGKNLLALMKEKDVKVVIGSDSHHILDEQGAEKIWKGEGKYEGELVREQMNDAGINNVYEIGMNDKQADLYSKISNSETFSCSYDYTVKNDKSVFINTGTHQLYISYDMEEELYLCKYRLLNPEENQAFSLLQVSSFEDLEREVKKLEVQPK